MIHNGRGTSPQTRYIAVRFFWVKDRVDSHEIILEHVPSEAMLADLLTKPLHGAAFHRLPFCSTRVTYGRLAATSSFLHSLSIYCIYLPLLWCVKIYSHLLCLCASIAGVCWEYCDTTECYHHALLPLPRRCSVSAVYISIVTILLKDRSCSYSLLFIFMYTMLKM